jgi:hypothetical protein
LGESWAVTSTTLKFDLHLLPTISRCVEPQAYDPALEDVTSILADLCDAAEGVAEFEVRGFGQERWPVDVRTDLLVFLEQLPAVLCAVKAGVATEIDFYEQGIERTISLVPVGNLYRATCVSRTTWQPDPAVEDVGRGALEGMLTRVLSRAMVLMERVSPELVQHAWVRAWLGPDCMKALFPLLADAKSKAASWTVVEVKLWLTSLANAWPDWQLDWEEGDENWIRVLSDGRVLGYVSAEMPIAFFQDAYAAKVVGLARGGLPIVHAAEDFDLPAFSTTRREMEDIFGRALSTSLDYGRLSVNDLWWATVS